MDVLGRVEKSEEKVKNVFKQLLERLSVRKTPRKQVMRTTVISTSKKQIERGRRLSLAHQFKNHCPPRKSSQVLSRSIKTSITLSSKEYMNYSRRVPIKGSLSNRCHTEEPSDVPSKDNNNCYNQFLITKSYLFQGLKRKPAQRIKGVTCSNLTRKNETNIKQYKREKLQHHRHYSYIGRKEEERSKTEHLNNICNGSGFQPWETEDTL